MSTLAVEPPGRRSLKRAQAGTRRLAELLIVLAALWGLWEGSRWLWIHEGWTWPFDVNDITVDDAQKQLTLTLSASSSPNQAMQRTAPRSDA